VVFFHFPGGYPIYIFTVTLAFGILTGLLWVVWNAEQKNRGNVLDAGCWLLLGSLIGGRIVYGLVNLDFSSHSLSEIFQLQLGGFSWIGALTGWLLAGVIYKRFHRKAKECSLDELLPLAGWLIGCMWIGSWLDGVVYGSLTNSWWGLSAVDEWGIADRRVPLQWIGAFCSILLFWSLERLAAWKARPAWLFADGQISLMAGSGISLIMVVISLFRADQTPHTAFMRLETLAALGIVVLLVVWLFISALIYNKNYR